MADSITNARERLVYADEGVSVGEVGDIAIAIWRESVTRSRFKHQAQGLASVVARAPGACGFMCIVETACRPPEEDMRRASVEMLNLHGTRLPMLACVIEGDGFRAAVTRSVMAGMAMIAGSRHLKINAFGSVTAASTWLASSNRFGPLTGLPAAVERLRGQMPTPAAQRASR